MVLHTHLESAASHCGIGTATITIHKETQEEPHPPVLLVTGPLNSSWAVGPEVACDLAPVPFSHSLGIAMLPRDQQGDMPIHSLRSRLADASWLGTLKKPCNLVPALPKCNLGPIIPTHGPAQCFCRSPPVVPNGSHMW